MDFYQRARIVCESILKGGWQPTVRLRFVRETEKCKTGRVCTE